MMLDVLPPEPTGADLAAAIELAARHLGIAATEFARPLSSLPDKWLRQTRVAKTPKPATIARVRALLQGREVPPPPPNNFQSKGARASPRVRAAGMLDPPVPPDFVPIDREPCWRCGVRGDIGCRHQPARMGEAA